MAVTTPLRRGDYATDYDYRHAVAMQEREAARANGTLDPSSTPTTTTADSGARATIQATLDTYGLGSLADWYWNQVTAGVPDAQIMIDLRKTPEYQQRFPGMAALSAKGQAIDEGTYISLERQYQSLFRQAGLPQGFYDSPDDFGTYIANNVSPNEMQGRLDVAKTAAYDTPPEVRVQLARLYNTDIGGVTAYLLDPEKSVPLLQKQFAAAESAAAGQLSGYGTLTRDEAERIAQFGRSFADTQTGFNELANSKELFAALPGETDVINRNDQLDAAFGGNGNAQRRIEQKRRQREATFSESGQTGGFGVAST